MRRRSASALSTATVREVSNRVTCSACTSSVFGPSSDAASLSCRAARPTVTHGAMRATPSRPAALAAKAPGPCVISNSQNLADSPGNDDTQSGRVSIATEPGQMPYTTANDNVSTIMRTRWWPISRHRAAVRNRAHSRPHHLAAVTGGYGSAMRTFIRAAVRLRSSRPSSRLHTKPSQHDRHRKDERRGQPERGGDERHHRRKGEDGDRQRRQHVPGRPEEPAGVSPW